MRQEGDPRGKLVRRIAIGVCATLLLPVAWEVLLSVRWGVQVDPQDMRPEVREALTSLGAAAIETRDVPVAAVLILGDSIIGKGRNTVVAAGEAGGHAEVNALSDALRRIGDERFALLTRDSLMLISTYEPCFMCTGALMNFGIKRVAFLKTKSIFHRLEEDYRLMLYRFRMDKREPGALQDSLFNLAWSRRR